MKTLKKNKIFLSGELFELEKRVDFLSRELETRGKTDCQIEKLAEELNIINRLTQRARKCVYNEQYGWCDSYSRKIKLKIEKATKLITQKMKKNSFLRNNK